MSAPVTHDPLVVNTQDGSCWRRRAVTREGRGLYALADVQGDVPELMLSTLAELAEHGLSSMSMYALPVPAGPVLRSELDQARDDVAGACLARWEEEQENARLRLALASAQRGRRELRARVADLEQVIADAPASYVLMERARAAAADAMTQRIAPTQALREDDEFHLHHDYRTPHDLPEPGGQR
jgi:hypothetical protein